MDCAKDNLAAEMELLEKLAVRLGFSSADEWAEYARKKRLEKMC